MAHKSVREKFGFDWEESLDVSSFYNAVYEHIYTAVQPIKPHEVDSVTRARTRTFEQEKLCTRVVRIEAELHGGGHFFYYLGLTMNTRVLRAWTVVWRSDFFTCTLREPNDTEITWFQR